LKDIPIRVAPSSSSVGRKALILGAVVTGTWLNQPHRAAGYKAPRPAIYPFLKHRDPVYAVIKSGYEALLRHLGIGRQQKREEVEAFDIVCK
jgi:hypothetical protein